MTDNRRLLFVAPSAYPQGGVATWLDYLLPGLEEQGWEPTLGLVAGKHHKPVRYLEEHPFHRVCRIHNPTGSQEGRVRSLCGAVLKVDPAMVLSVNIPDVYLAVSRLRKNGHSAVKAIMTLHGIQADLLGDAHAFRDVLDAVVCTNKLTCQLVEEAAGIVPERVYYAPYGVEEVVPTARRRTSAAGDPLRIAWVGRLEEEQKRVSDIPRILSALDGIGEAFELWIVGSGPDEARLREQLAPRVADGQVTFWGALPREAVFSDVYQQADVFLLTSSWETGPIVLWEAMSAGLPVVTSAYVGSGPEGSLVHEENCLMYPIGDIDGAAECISTLGSPTRCSKLGVGGLELVKTRYSVKASVEAWDAVLKRIAQGRAIEPVQWETQIASRGRLDGWVGVPAAETLRHALGIHFAHTEAGGEWPHAISGCYRGMW